MEDNVIGDERLSPEGKITLIFSEESNCYMIRFNLRNFEKYYFRLWLEEEQSPYVTESDFDSGSDSWIDVAG